MKDELQTKLINNYPNLYSRCHYLSCGDGWYNLIDELSAKLEPLGVVVMQVKEKFSGLRFYIDIGTDEAFDLIREAESKSVHICEKCGKPGETRATGWIKTLCDECFKKY